MEGGPAGTHGQPKVNIIGDWVVAVNGVAGDATAIAKQCMAQTAALEMTILRRMPLAHAAVTPR